ncbi:hypothetical protein [Sphingomonas mucosissima]|uniref:Sulfotransferase family protein n=1 Tax=Sphingomonas mucosissima TaxID=370959 RepID=A0A245ZMH4_9SPHN|nr:hypothetical protein [Sphingomonas mucosissima]OWK30939.1 hypothetical protein SPMU_19300 [Sphingomonas mucosissima]
MRGKRHAIVHIGHKKTGTTFIQNHLHANRSALFDAGVIYPLPEPNHSYALSGIFHAGKVVKAPSPRVRYASDRKRAREALHSELCGADWHTMVLSAEAVAGFSPGELKDFAGWLAGHVDTTQIIFVVRDPVDWAVSVAQQRLKTRGEVEALLAEPEPPRWSKIITRFRETFGPRAVTVLEYEQLSAEREHFAARFACAAGLPANVAGALVGSDIGAVNESLSMEAALMLGRYNARVPQRIGGRRNPARSGMEPRAFFGLPGQKFDLPDAARRKAYVQSREDVAFLAQEFGITRYSYPASDLAPSRYTEEVSPEFLEALADRMVSLQAQAMANQLLWGADRLRYSGDDAAAAAAIDTAAARFPTDERVIRATAGRRRGKIRRR